MAVTSVVKLSELEGARRIDAEYYQPEYLMIDRNIKKFDTVYLLGQLIYSFSSGKNLPQVSYNPKNVAYIRTQNVRSIIIDVEGLTSVDSSVKNFDLLDEGDILFVRVGEGVGNSSIITPYWAKNTFSDNVIRVKIKKINPYFAITYLNSRYGLTYLERVKKGSARSLVSKENIYLIKIFEPKKEIEEFCKNKILKTQDLIIESQSLYSQAESLLLSELGLQHFEPKDKLSYEVSLSQASTIHRIDAEYFNPSYEEILEKIKKYKNGYGKLLNFAESIKPNFEPKKFPQKTFSYVELADINASIGVIQSSTNITGEEAPSRAKRILKKDDVIVSSVEGSLEKVALVDEQFEGSLASTGFFQLRPKDILPEVLLVLAKSPVIQSQLKKECAGTILTAVPKEALRKLIIPDLPNQTQQKIAKLVQESHEARKKAKQLLEEAKKKVEDTIEKQN